jgi:hypothetical protein
MTVYCVLSEMFEEHCGELDPPEWGRLAVIVAARSRGQARYLAIRSDRGLKTYRPVDWPKLYCKRLGDGVLLNEGVINPPAADKWWERVGDWEPELGAMR